MLRLVMSALKFTGCAGQLFMLGVMVEALTGRAGQFDRLGASGEAGGACCTAGIGAGAGIWAGAGDTERELDCCCGLTGGGAGEAVRDGGPPMRKPDGAGDAVRSGPAPMGPLRGPPVLGAGEAVRIGADPSGPAPAGPLRGGAAPRGPPRGCSGFCDRHVRGHTPRALLSNLTHSAQPSSYSCSMRTSSPWRSSISSCMEGWKSSCTRWTFEACAGPAALADGGAAELKLYCDGDGLFGGPAKAAIGRLLPSSSSGFGLSSRSDMWLAAIPPAAAAPTAAPATAAPGIISFSSLMGETALMSSARGTEPCNEV